MIGIWRSRGVGRRVVGCTSVGRWLWLLLLLLMVLMMMWLLLLLALACLL